MAFDPTPIELPEEMWQQLYDDYDYQISNRGRFRSVDRLVPTTCKGVKTFRKQPGRILNARKVDKTEKLYIKIHFPTIDKKKQFLNINVAKAMKDHWPETIQK